MSYKNKYRSPGARRVGNQFTGVYMTKREAQRLHNYAMKIEKITNEMKKRGVYYEVTKKLEESNRLIYSSIIKSDRLGDV